MKCVEKNYPEFLKKVDKSDNLGQRINFVLRQIINQCLLVKAKKQVKNNISNSRYGQKCCDKILKESWKIGCDFPKRKNLDGSHRENQKNLFLQEGNILVGK